MKKNQYYLNWIVWLFSVIPVVGQNLDQTSPGTVVATIVWLSVEENGSVCSMKKPLVSDVLILNVNEVGSGLVNPPVKGDTLKVALRKLGGILPKIDDRGKYMMQENPCFTSNHSYYSIFFKD